MAPTEVTSPEQFSDMLKGNRIVVVDFYADWCGPCKQIAPIFNQLASGLSKPGVSAFARINVEGDKSKALATEYKVTSLPTFIVFRNGQVADKVTGADPMKLKSVIQKLSADIENTTPGESSYSGSGMMWRGAELPARVTDITDVVNPKNLELLNVEDGCSAASLFKRDMPSALKKKLGKAAGSEENDWIQSDTDAQLLLYVEFNSSVKIHTVQLTSLPPDEDEDEDEDDELPERPGKIKFFINQTKNPSFEEAESDPATQEIIIGNEGRWNEETGTVSLGLRYVRFQKVTSLVIFIDKDEDSDTEKIRLDRIRFIGESGEKREMGKLEKIGDEAGE